MEEAVLDYIAKRCADRLEKVEKEAAKTVYGKVLVNHRDGVKTNNDHDNLEWCTYSENVKHSMECVNLVSNDNEVKKTKNAKLTKEDVEFIRSNYKHKDSKFGFAPLGRRFSVKPLTIRNVVERKTWKHI